MNKTIRFLMAASISLMTGIVTANNNYSGDEHDYPGIHRSPKRIIPATVNYNSSSTALTVKFPTTNGGKVEIYRNGVKVVSTNAATGTTLSYTLRNYGKGNYTVIVSSGNTVVYNSCVEVKN